MTPQEALKMVQDCGLNIVPPYHDEVLKVIEECVGKQIPKKPLNKSAEYDGTYGKCPCCNTILTDYSNSKRCSDCGQAVDWSDNE